MAIRAALAFVGMAVALSVMHDTAILWTLGLSLSGANLIAAAYLHRSQVRALPRLPAEKLHRLLGDLVASLVAIMPGLAVTLWLTGVADDHYHNIGICIAAVAASGLAYLLIQWTRGSVELKSLLSGIFTASPNTGRGAPSG
jgi:hypothetical protein